MHGQTTAELVLSLCQEPRRVPWASTVSCPTWQRACPPLSGEGTMEKEPRTLLPAHLAYECHQPAWHEGATSPVGLQVPLPSLSQNQVGRSTFALPRRRPRVCLSCLPNVSQHCFPLLPGDKSTFPLVEGW